MTTKFNGQTYDAGNAIDATMTTHYLANRISSCIQRQSAKATRFPGILLAALAFAQPATATENDAGAWLTFATTDAFHTDSGDSRWRYWFDAQIRYFDIGSGINQYALRPAIGYRLQNNVNVWLGYARFRSRNRAGTVVDENRYWQQVDWTAGQWADGTVTMRTRLEQKDVSAGNDVGLVIRFLTKYVRPLGTSGQTKLVVAVEPFADLKDTDWGGDSGLAQNRAFLGLGWTLSNKVSLEAGYMNQYIWRDNASDINNHLAIFNFRVSL